MTVSAWSQWYRRSERGRPAPPAVARSAGGVTLRGLDAWGCGGERGGRGGQGGGRGVVEDRVEGDQLDVHRRAGGPVQMPPVADRKSTRLNSSHSQISYAVFCLKKKKKTRHWQ